MKVTPEHLEAMSSLIKPLDTDDARSRYVAGDFPNADKTRDLDKRYRWDLFWASGSAHVLWNSGTDYADAHIDTALRNIVRPLEVTK